MKKISNLAIKLFSIAAVSALILGLTNMNTQPVIEQRQADLFKQSYSVAYPSGKDFKTVEEKVNENLDEIIEVSDGTNQVGYIFKAVGFGGYGGPINFIVGISNEGIVQGFKAISHSETKGYGSKIEEEAFVNGVNEVNVSKGVSYGNGNKEAGEIQAISGATKSTSAIANGLMASAIKLSELSSEIDPIGETVEPYYASYYGEFYKSADKYYEVKMDSPSKELVRIVEAHKGNEFLGTIIQLKGNGYGGPINMLVGVNKDKKIESFKFVSQNETPDIGGVIEDDVYMNNLVGKSLASGIKLKTNPKRDKDILVISGATVTSNAMKDALNAGVEGLKIYEKNKENLDELDINKIIDEETKTNSLSYADLFDEVDKTEAIENVDLNNKLIAVHKAYKEDREVGYVFDIKSDGFAGEIKLASLVDEKGIIKDFVVYKQSETEGLGDFIANDEFKKNLIGKDISKIKSFKGSEKPSKEEEVMAVAGATYSSEGIVSGLNSLADAYKLLKK